jgi:hypothetical protein
MSGIIDDVLHSTIYPVWKQNTPNKKTFLTLPQAKPFIRVFLDFAIDPPNMDAEEWVQLLSVMTCVLLFEPQVNRALTITQLKELLFLTGKVGQDIATKCMYEPEMIVDESDFHPTLKVSLVAKKAMLCSFLCLCIVKNMTSISQEEDALVRSHLKCLASHTKTPHSGYTLLHVLSDWQNICDMPISTKTLYMGEKEIDVSTNGRGKIFPFVPHKDHVEMAITVGGANPDAITSDGKSALDLSCEWFTHNRDHKFFAKHKYRFIAFVKYMWDAGVGCEMRTSQIMELLKKTPTDEYSSDD